MPNSIKYSTSPQSLALKTGNYWIGTGDVEKSPTSTTDYWNGIDPPTNGYTIYLNKASNGPSIYVANNDSELITQTNSISGASFTSATQCLVYFSGESDKMVFNRNYESIVTNGLVICLDGGFTPSYPRSGTTCFDVSSSGNNGTLVNGVGYNTTAGGVLQFTGASNQYVSTGYVLPGNVFTISVWFNVTSVGAAGTYNTIAIININNYQLLTVLAGTPNIFQFWSSDIGTGQVLNSPSISINTWYNVTYVREGNSITNGYKAYWNGLFTGAQNTGFWTTSSTFWLGSRSDVSNQALTGLIGNTLIYTRALLASEILQNFNAQKARYGL